MRRPSSTTDRDPGATDALPSRAQHQPSRRAAASIASVCALPVRTGITTAPPGGIEAIRRMAVRRVSCGMPSYWCNRQAAPQSPVNIGLRAEATTR